MKLQHSLMDEISPSPTTNRDLPPEYVTAVKNGGDRDIKKAKSSFAPGTNNNIFSYRQTARETLDTGRTRSTRDLRVPSLNLEHLEDPQG